MASRKTFTLAEDPSCGVRGPLMRPVQTAAGSSDALPPLSDSLTRSQRIAVERRQKILNLVASLEAQGWTQGRAAKVVKVSVPTLWRWQRRIIPRFDKCGGTSVFNQFKISPALIAKVQRLHLAGETNEKAWRAVAGDRACPKDLAAFLRLTPRIPARFIEASRIKKIQATVLIGSGFTHIQQP